MESLVTHHISDLFEKTVDSLFLILRDLSTINEIKAKPHLMELEETLQELEVIWHDSHTDRNVMIDELLNLKSGLELFSDYLYRATKKIKNEDYICYQQSLLQIATAFINWTSFSGKMRLKLLTSGLLYSQIEIIKILTQSTLHNKELLTFVTLHLELLFKCFISSKFSLFYIYSGKKWYELLSPIIQIVNCPETILLTKLVALVLAPTFTTEQLLSFKLSDEEYHYLLQNITPSSESYDHTPFGMALTVTLKESLLILQKIALQSNHSLLASSTALSSLVKISDSSSLSEKKALFKLLLVMKSISSPDIDLSSFVESLQQYKCHEDLCLSVDSEAILYLIQCKGTLVIINSQVEALIKVVTLLLEKIERSGMTLSCDLMPFSEFLIDMFDTMFVLSKVNTIYRNELIEIIVKPDILKLLYEVATKLFNGLLTVCDEVVPCLTMMFHCILYWSECKSKLPLQLIDTNLVMEHIQQLMILSAPEYTWFIKFLVHLNLGIILNCVRNVDISYNECPLKDVNWSQLLNPWLKSTSQTARIMAYFITSHILYEFEDADTLSVMLHSIDIDCVQDSFTNAVHSTNLSVPMFDNLCTVSVVTLLAALTKLMQLQKEIVDPVNTINLISTLLLSGNEEGIVAGCNYITALQGSSHTNQLYKQSELPIREILEQIQESEDSKLKHSAEKALFAIQGHKEIDINDSSARKYGSLITNITLMLKNAFPDYGSISTELCSMLTEMWTLYCQCTSEIKIKLSEYTVSTGLIKEINKFICSIIEKTEDSPTAVVYQCLSIILSAMASWTDVSQNMRYRIMETQVLIYIADFVCSLSSITDNEMEAIKHIVVTATIVLSNCAQEKEFGWFYTSPGFDWFSILESWVSSSYGPLRFSAKLISGYIAHVLDKEKVSYLVSLTESDMSTLLQMVYQSVVSETHVASGFGCQFSAVELISLLQNFLINQVNFLAVIQSQEILPSLLLLLNTDKLTEKKTALRLLLVLANSLHLRQNLNDISAFEIISEVKENAEDACVKFLSECALLSLQGSVDYGNVGGDVICCDSTSLPQIRAIFIKLLNELVELLSVVLAKIEGGKLIMNTSNSTHIHILDIVREVHSFWMKASDNIQIELAEGIAIHPSAMDLIHRFLIKAYRALISQKDNFIGPCFMELLLCVLEWIQKNNSISSHIVRSGLLLEYMKFHQRPSLIKESNFSRFLVHCQLTLMLVCIELPQIHVYYDKVDWFNCLSPLSTSEDSTIQLLSKMVAGFVTPTLSEDKLSLLQFSYNDAQTLIDLIYEAACSNNYHTKGIFKFHLSILLKSINCLLTIPALSEQLHELSEVLLASHDGLLSHLLTFTQNCVSENAKLEACKLIFYILENKVTLLQESLRDQIYSVMSSFAEVFHSNATGFIEVVECIVMTIQNNGKTTGLKSYIIYAKGYYSLQRWNDCIMMCDKILKNTDQTSLHGNMISELKLLKGKSLYHCFLEKQRKLKLAKLSIDVKKSVYEKVYTLNKEVILLFGEALDHGYLDDEASAMFDRAMMDCIFEANMLESCYRCYLCRRNLKNQSQDSSKIKLDTQSDDKFKAKTGSKSNRQEKLIKSHIIPRAILEEFAGSLNDDSKQVLFSQKSAIAASQKRLISPGELAYYMLCRNCEDVISGCGESQFLPNFFRKIYNKKDDVQTTDEQYIEYGPWLYQFCIGLLFRALHWSIDDYVNNETIYKVLKSCQTQIMSWVMNKPCSDAPDVYIFVSPLSVGLEEIQHGYMNWFLTGAIGEYFGKGNTFQYSLLEATFFIVHIGCINIFVSFEESFPRHKYNHFCINPVGGVFWVPKANERRHQLPTTLWSLFRSLSKTIRDSIWEMSHKLSKSLKNVHFNSDAKDNTFGIHKAMLADAEPIMRHLVLDTGTLPESINTINLLPPEFSVRPTNNPRKLLLPKGHCLLLHSNYVRGSKEGSSFFVAVGRSGKYPIDKPYVIWHFYSPRSHVNCGAFFSVETLNITNFLVNDDPTLFTHQKGMSHVHTAKERMPQILKDLFKEKGFSSIKSLLYRLKSAVNRGRDIPPFDTKCHSDRKCWFCRYLCQNCCIKPFAYGRVSNTPQGIAYLCNEHCQKLTPEKFGSQQFVVITASHISTEDISIHCGPISPLHRELSHVYLRLLNQKNFPCEMEVALCIGDGTEGCPPNRPYIVFYSHHLFHQLFAEFFVNTELLAEEPLPQVANETSWNAILQLNDAQAIRKCFEKCDVLEEVLQKIFETTQYCVT